MIFMSLRDDDMRRLAYHHYGVYRWSMGCQTSPLCPDVSITENLIDTDSRDFPLPVEALAPACLEQVEADVASDPGSWCAFSFKPAKKHDHVYYMKFVLFCWQLGLLPDGARAAIVMWPDQRRPEWSREMYRRVSELRLPVVIDETNGFGRVASPSVDFARTFEKHKGSMDISYIGDVTPDVAEIMREHAIRSVTCPPSLSLIGPGFRLDARRMSVPVSKWYEMIEGIIEVLSFGMADISALKPSETGRTTQWQTWYRLNLAPCSDSLGLLDGIRRAEATVADVMAIWDDAAKDKRISISMPNVGVEELAEEYGLRDKIRAYMSGVPADDIIA